MSPLPVKTTDSKGRLTLGREFAGKQFFINHKDSGVIQIIPAETVPAREAWLFKNPAALSVVLEGLEQARKGQLSKGPDMAKALAFADKIEG